MLRLAMKSVLSRKARLFLTSLAVILGTSFLAGATIFTDTLNKTFDTLFAEVFQEVDGFVRSTDVIETDFGGEERARISIDYVERITSVPGVADAQGFIQTFARIVGKDGKPIGSEGAPLGAPAGGSGSSLLHLAPMAARRIRAAGPGRFSATLRMRTPLRLLSVSWKSGCAMGCSI